MAKKRRNHTPEVVVTLPSSPPMRAAIPGTRSVKDLRSDAVAKLRQETKAILDNFNSFKEAPHDLRSHKSRPAPRKNENLQTTNRNLHREFELRKSSLPAQVRHDLQDRLQVLACEERRTRKEVMFAMRRTGKAGRRNKKAVWTSKSHMRCR